MSLPPHELKALAIELAAAMPPLAEPDQARERVPADMLFNEMDAVIACLYDRISAGKDKRNRDVAYALVMVLERLNNELGRTTGVIA